jgi:outer membrane immunogenic protein
MYTMKKKLWLAAVTGLALTTSSAFAADLGQPYYKAPPAPPVVAPPSWTGFYLGIEGGWGWAHAEQSDATGFDSGRFNVNGGLVGGTFGYNWQVNQIVLGLEGDGSWADIHGSTAGIGLGCDLTCSAKLDALGTVRGRFGVAFGNFLPYITGGLAVGDIHGTESLLGSGSSTEVGWTAGGGIEAKVSDAWSIKAEYLYADLGNHAIFDDDFGGGVIESEHIKFTTNIVRAGLNYHFNVGGPETHY